MDLTVYLEEIQNVCWKLAFHFRQCAFLLDTLEPEMERRSKEAVFAADVWLNLLMKGTTHQTFGYYASRLGRTFIGNLPHDMNRINQSMKTLEEQESDDDWQGTLAPLSASVGCLAPEGKLKPYSLDQMQRQKEGPLRAMTTERWRGIRPNYAKLHAQLEHANPKGLSFTLLVFCDGTLPPTPAFIEFMQQLCSPLSLLHQYNGERCPQKKSPFEDLESSLFSLLVISPASRQEAQLYLEQTSLPVIQTHFPCGLQKVFLDHDQQCYKAYEMHSPGVVLIRPDGFIGTRLLLDYSLLTLYLRSIFTLEQNAASVFAAGYTQ
ncbi:hypothetical protein BY458DRAFT_499342 [Sporodiniella umbellata]|nr:hypothetical protein BY458DRAFT_499342 [Sporodiniella umbellata]